MSQETEKLLRKALTLDSAKKDSNNEERVCVCIGDETRGKNRYMKKGFPNQGESLKQVSKKLHIAPGQKMRVKVWEGKDLVNEFFYNPETGGFESV